jgi:hypothetical protein
MASAASAPDAAGTRAPPAASAAAAAAVLDELPPWALSRVLSCPALALEDLARAACVSRPLRTAVADAAPAKWRRVRAAGKTLSPLDEDFFQARA